MREKTAAWRATRNATPGDPAASSAAAILEVVDAEEPPLRVFFCAAPLEIAKADYASRLETWEKWNDVSLLAQGRELTAPRDHLRHHLTHRPDVLL